MSGEPSAEVRSVPETPVAVVSRPRLLHRLRGRFDRRLTAVVAGPGYGKTTLLSHAVAENRLDPLGTDIWVTLTERERAPSNLMEALSYAIAHEAAIADTVDELIDLLVVRSPREVCLVLDDVHVIDGSASTRVVSDLFERLPPHGHLMVASRSMPDLAVRRLQLSGAAEVVEADDLGFTPDELVRLGELSGLSSELALELPPWPALAVLSGTVGQRASVDYVWEAVIESLSPERRTSLALLAQFDLVDDELVRAVIGSYRSAAELFAGVPLVDPVGDEFRMHDLWRSALGAIATAEQRREALRAGAEVLVARGDVVAAARCFRAAGDVDQLLGLVRSFVTGSISAGLDRARADALFSILPPAHRDGAVGTALRVIQDWNDDVEGRLQQLETRALAEDDDEMRSLARWRLTQRHGNVDPFGVKVSNKTVELADAGWPLAKLSIALVKSHEAEGASDVDAALAALDDFVAPDPAVLRSALDSRLVALGHPERVSTSLVEVLETGATEPVTAHAAWLRGDIDPTDAWPIAATLPATYGRRRMVDVQVPLLGIVSAVGVAAGALPEARGLALEAAHLAPRTYERLQCFAGIAGALVSLAEGDEERAVAEIEALLDTIALRPWPTWAYLGALCPIRAFIDDTEWLDALGAGPSLQLAIQAGRTFREIREGAPPSGAAALPWGQPQLLRVHVPPPMLAELAVAAIPSTPAASAVFDTIPYRGRSLGRILDHPSSELRSSARRIVVREPLRPGHELRIVTLGRFGLERSDGRTMPTLDGRSRLRELLAVLVLERSLTRDAAAARLWPDLPVSDAANNLRVTLHKLLAVLEPDRGDVSVWSIRTTADRLELSPEGISVDVDEFDALLAHARLAEQHGAPSMAYESYGQMRSVYGGEFCPGVPEDLVFAERARVQGIAYGAVCRQAELKLAQGEPELAMVHAVDAERLDPLGPRVRIGRGGRGERFRVHVRLVRVVVGR